MTTCYTSRSACATHCAVEGRCARCNSSHDPPRPPHTRPHACARTCAAQAWAKTIIPHGRAYRTYRFERVTELLRHLLDKDHDVDTDDARGFFDWLESTEAFPDNDVLARRVTQLVSHQTLGREGLAVQARSDANVKVAKMWLFTTMTAPNQAATIRVGDSTVDIGGNSGQHRASLMQWYTIYLARGG